MCNDVKFIVVAFVYYSYGSKVLSSSTTYIYTTNKLHGVITQDNNANSHRYENLVSHKTVVNFVLDMDKTGVLFGD